MKLWKKASGALKDKNSILISSLTTRTSYRNPDLEAAIIKTTSHDETRVDYKNAKRVFSWIRTSPTYIKPFINALSMRLEKTHSWVVALKGLMLMHGVFFLKIPAVKRVGRLPFDLSKFSDESYSSSSRGWNYNGFIRAYFVFLDKKSAFFTMVSNEERSKKNKRIDETIVQQIIKIQHYQTLLDMLMKIKPERPGMRGNLFLEAMGCVLIEVFDVYARICNGIARVSIRIYGAGKTEATLALSVLQNAAKQNEQLSKYFDFCKGMGILNASEFPKVENIPDEDIRELENMINGVSDKNVDDYDDDEKMGNIEDKQIVVIEKTEDLNRGNVKTEDLNRGIAKTEDLNGGNMKTEDLKRGIMKTIITQHWEMFDEDYMEGNNGGFLKLTNFEGENEDRVEKCLNIQPYQKNCKQEIPDLISF